MQQNQVTVFDFNGQSLNCVLDEAGNPLFRADDVCEILAFANPWDAIQNHVDQDDLAKREVIDSLGRTQLANHVNESGLYSLIFGSKKLAAKAFKRWVTSEVLPSIRKTGAYTAPAAESSLAAQKLAVDAAEVKALVRVQQREFELSRAASEGATERLENLCREMSNEFFTLRQTVETLLHVDNDLRSRMDAEIQAVQTTLDAVIYKQEAVNSELHRTVKTLHDDIRELRQLVMQSR